MSSTPKFPARFKIVDVQLFEDIEKDISSISLLENPDVKFIVGDFVIDQRWKVYLRTSLDEVEPFSTKHVILWLTSLTLFTIVFMACLYLMWVSRTPYVTLSLGLTITVILIAYA